MPVVTKEYMGVHWRRLSARPLERKLAFAWQEENKESHLFKTLMDGEYTDRDMLVACTVIQWLGSDSGQWFLDRALKGGDLSKTQKVRRLSIRKLVRRWRGRSKV